MLPNFIIIGAMKSGTSSLYRYISSHPDITGSKPKEPEFFSQHFANGLDWYRACFDTDDKYHFEASTGYTKRQLWPKTASRIHNTLPSVKLIYVVRDPIERLRSHYMHNVADATERKPFSQAIYDKRYIDTSNYYYQLEPYIARFSTAQIKLVTFENLATDPVACLSDIFSFLAIPPIYDPAALEQIHNKSASKSRRLTGENLLKKVTTPSLLRPIRHAVMPLKRPVRRFFNPLRKDLQKPVLLGADYRDLANRLRPDVDKLREFAQYDFPHWNI